jgi:putative phosphoesterase
MAGAYPIDAAMKIAVISDIHGNLAALDAVLADVATRGIMQIVNLGDILSGPLFPAETAERLMALDLPTIKGNHERQLLTLAPGAMGESDRHAYAVLNAEHLGWIRALPDELRLSDDVLMVHGTRGSDLHYFLETVTPDGLRAATMAEVEARAADADAALILCGHTHVPRIVRLGDGRMVVNPGSVGLPAYADDRPFPHAIETGSPHARYALVERDGEGAWHADLLCVAYDWEGAAALAQARGRDDWARALRTGRV